MYMKENQKFKGLIAATFTPMDEKGEINLQVIDSYTELLIRSGIKGVFICGTAGESASLTVEERKSITSEWVRCAKGKLKIIVHTGSNSLNMAKELATHAYETGADGFASIAPNFFKPATVKDMIDFFAPVAACAKDLPFYFYHFPSITGVNLSAVEFLSEGKKHIPNLRGVKFTHNNLMEMAQCIDLENGAFQVFNGYDDLLLSGLSLGVEAAVGSTFSYLPGVYLGMMDAFDKGDIEKARKLQLRSIEIINIINKYGGPVRGGKAIMNLINIECGPCRLPIAPFRNDEYNLLKEDLRNCLNFP